MCKTGAVIPRSTPAPHPFHTSHLTHRISSQQISLSQNTILLICKINLCQWTVFNQFQSLAKRQNTDVQYSAVLLYTLQYKYWITFTRGGQPTASNQSAPAESFPFCFSLWKGMTGHTTLWMSRVITKHVKFHTKYNNREKNLFRFPFRCSNESGLQLTWNYRAQE